ncbi:DNA primase [Helicobacter sp. 13S00477-4]|uniref:DNA primase n=1 Tax=Helicobacter sp. 13S00477-4 TaxID=1905759 RepID=UPI000BA555C5|nr:DNA primase [Helicobacter sp. 13S00477-4]PAF51977.1 DNA primase [Helicobacter sp. 13S00477-4]
MNMIINISQFKQCIDIVQVISHYVPLKKNGANHIGACPFHSEKTPSFTVSVSKGIYHCFGCGVGGDAIEFVQSYEKLPFNQAVEKIASLIGFSLEYSNERAVKIDTSLLEYSKDFFISSLGKNPQAKEYFLHRGLNDESIEKFGLGFCPYSFEYIKSIQSKDIDFGISVGLINKDNNANLYTPFSNRLMFPIWDNKGRVIGFGGRILDNSSPSAKYINSKESASYHKRQVLYGFHLARNAIVSKAQAIITEGYMDTIALHQIGINHSIATCGTALSSQQIAQLTRLGAKIILCFDRDKAGLNATYKAIDLLICCGIYESEVLQIQGGKDACELLATGELKDKILSAKRIPIIEFMLLNLCKKSDSIESMNLTIIEIKKFLATIKNDFIKATYTQKASELLNIPAYYLEVKETSKITMPNPTFSLTEASIIKTIISEPQMIDIVIDWLDIDDFSISLQGCVQNLAKGIIDSQAREIALNDSIPLCSNIVKSLRAVYEISSKKKMKNIKFSNIPIEEKFKKIISIRERLLKWK